MSDALQSRQYLNDRGTPLVERLLKDLFTPVEGLQARLRVVDLRLDIAHGCCRLDKLAVERPPIIAERLNLQPELGLAVHGLALLGPNSVELLIVPSECIVGGRRLTRGRHRPERKLGTRRLRESCQIGPKR